MLDFLPHRSFLLGFRHKENWKKPTGDSLAPPTIERSRYFPGAVGRLEARLAEPFQLIAEGRDLAVAVWASRLQLRAHLGADFFERTRRRRTSAGPAPGWPADSVPRTAPSMPAVSLRDRCSRKS